MNQKQKSITVLVLLSITIVLSSWQLPIARGNILFKNHIPVVFKTRPIPTSPVLLTINNSDQNNIYTVTWTQANNANSYVLQEALDPLFVNTINVFHGNELSWTAPYPGKIPNPYYYRVKGINEIGESPWSNTQQVTIYPLFVGLQARWDGNGYIRGYDYYDIGTHETRSYDQLSEGYIIRANIHFWYSPNPIGWPEEYLFNYYSVTSGEFLSSSVPPDPSWKWGYSALLPYNIQFHNGQTAIIGGQAFLVSGPISGYTSFGAPVQYWQLINRDQFLFWDGGGEWKQYVYAGEAILRYDAGNTRLLIYDDVKRHYTYQGNPYNETVQYISNLTAANSFPGGLAVDFGITGSDPPEITIVNVDVDSPILTGLRK